MTLESLIKSIGQENIAIEWLSERVCGNVTLNRKGGGTTVQFVTHQTSPIDFVSGDGKSGLVLWLSSKQLKELLKAEAKPVTKETA